MSLPTCSSGYQIPGPSGAAGANGTNGTNGLNAVSRLTAPFTVPAIGFPVNIVVDDTTWLQSGNGPTFAYIAVQGAGLYQIATVTDATHATIINTGFSANAIAGTVVPIGSYIAPSGAVGATGATGPAGPSGTPLPTTTKGDLVVEQAAGPHPNPARFAVGATGDVLHADATQALGLQYRAVDVSNNTTNIIGALAVSNGGTNATTKQGALNSLLGLAGLAAGDLIRYDGANWSLTHTPGGTAAFFRADGTYAVPTSSAPVIGNTGLQLITANWDVAHGLNPLTPRLVNFYLQNTTAEYGYNPGDRIPISNVSVGDITGGTGGSFYVNGTNIGWYSQAAGGTLINILRRDTGGHANLTPANWRLIAYFTA